MISEEMMLTNLKKGEHRKLISFIDSAIFDLENAKISSFQINAEDTANEIIKTIKNLKKIQKWIMIFAKETLEEYEEAE